MFYIQVSAEQSNSLSKPERGNQVSYRALPVQLETEWVPLGTRVLLQPCPPSHNKTSLLLLCSQDKPPCSVGLIYPEQVKTEQVCVGQTRKGTPNIFSFCPLHTCRLCHQTADTGMAQEPLSGSSQVSRVNLSCFSICTT